MSTKHTPGPWHADAAGQITAQADASLPLLDYQVALTVAPVAGTKGREIREANARLIAAAPELLEALQSIAEYWNRDQNETAMADACWHAIKTAMAAITKATGEQQ